MSKSIGEILNSKRRELGFSQAELASALAIDGIEVTNQAISKWETGSTLPNARQFLALCRALEIDDISGTFDGGSRGGLLAGLNTVGRKKRLTISNFCATADDTVCSRSLSKRACCRCIRWPSRQAPGSFSTARIMI